MDPYKIILYPLMTEKTMDQTDKNNKLTFVVDMNATKGQVREAVEKIYKVKVVDVNTLVTMKGRKKATVRLAEGHSAEEIATGMGVL